MTEVTHQPCPFCDSSDAFSYNSDTGLFKCFACDAIPSKKRCLVFDGETLSDFKHYEPEEGISLDPYVPDTYRGITKATLEKCGVYFTEKDGKETVHYTYTNGVKHRELPKTIKNSGKMDTFYGQEDYNGGGNSRCFTPFV